jgi:hypothetical protein
MIPLFKTIFITGVFVCSFQIIYSQETEKTVTVTVSGSGKSQDEAKQTALRSAIEQTFGAFISSKTEMLNDQVVADQIASVSSGNIQSFTILNESQLPNGSWGVTLKAIVSVSKLTRFVEAKGVVVQIKGGLFALNIKQQLLNELGEVNAIAEMVGLLHEPMQISFDYTIKPGEPKSLDADSKNWEIPIEVTATANKNMDFCANYSIKTLSALSLSAEEVASYKSLNKDVYNVDINFNGVSKTFYLRKRESVNLLNTLTNQWNFYTRSFAVESGLDISYGNGEGLIHNFSKMGTSGRYNNNTNKYFYDYKVINFLTIGQKVGTFSWQDKRTLTQIEKMTGYTVKPRGVISQFKHGGFVVYERNGHGLVAAIFDLGELKWDAAKTACDELILNGYSDWHLPNDDELNEVYLELAKNNVGGFEKVSNGPNSSNVNYWSSTGNYLSANILMFKFGRFNYSDHIGEQHVRAVRAF